ncbi:unnamed protein product [marine sediment metagenome]|uniref:Uncharacterized protein n=1 Tax=marine sediment metagenome TaxID=412755 RepID=X1B9U1_9ZZZZ
MRIKNIWIVSTGLIAITICGMLTDNVELAAVAIGALAGWIGGNKNGNGG